MTRFEKLKQMSIDEVAEILGDSKRWPHSPCYICEYDEGPACASPVACTNEFKAKKYKEWLERECDLECGKNCNKLRCIF